MFKHRLLFYLSVIASIILLLPVVSFAQVTSDIKLDLTTQFISTYQTNICLDNTTNSPSLSINCRYHFLTGKKDGKDYSVGVFDQANSKTSLLARYSIYKTYSENFSYGFDGILKSDKKNEIDLSSYITMQADRLRIYLGKFDILDPKEVYIAQNDFVVRSFEDTNFIKETKNSRSLSAIGYPSPSLAPKSVMPYNDSESAIRFMMIVRAFEYVKFGLSYDNGDFGKSASTDLLHTKYQHNFAFIYNHTTNPQNYQFLFSTILRASINNSYDDDDFEALPNYASFLVNLGFESNDYELGLSALFNLDHYNPEGKVECSYREGTPIEVFCLPSIALRLNFTMPTRYFTIQGAFFTGLTAGVLFRNYFGNTEDSITENHGFDYFYKLGLSISKDIMPGFNVFLDGYYYLDSPTNNDDVLELSELARSSGFYLSFGTKVSF